MGWPARSYLSGGTIRYQPTKVSAAAWRVFMAIHVNKPVLSDLFTPEPSIHRKPRIRRVRGSKRSRRRCSCARFCPRWSFTRSSSRRAERAVSARCARLPRLAEALEEWPTEAAPYFLTLSRKKRSSVRPNITYQSRLNFRSKHVGETLGQVAIQVHGPNLSNRVVCF